MKWEKCLAGAHECLKQAKKNRSE